MLKAVERLEQNQQIKMLVELAGILCEIEGENTVEKCPKMFRAHLCIFIGGPKSFSC